MSICVCISRENIVHDGVDLCGGAPPAEAAAEAASCRGQRAVRVASKPPCHHREVSAKASWESGRCCKPRQMIGKLKGVKCYQKVLRNQESAHHGKMLRR